MSAAHSAFLLFLHGVLAGLFLGSPLPAQRPIGDWHGTLHGGANNLRLGMTFTTGEDGELIGTMVSPDEGVQFRIDAVSFAEGRLSFDIGQIAAHFTATWDAAQQGWAGSWTQKQAVPLILVPGSIPDSPRSTPNPLISRYADTRLAARLPDGRRINIVCMGQGKPTVLLDAGAGNWGAVWNRVQPVIARQTRICSWDRAGFGFSSASPAPQTVIEMTKDLEQALRANRIDGPFVVVGHSLGGIEALLFADRHKADVAGMVLVDPSSPDQAARMARVAPTLSQSGASNSATIIAYYSACADALDRRPADAPSCTVYDSDVPRSTFLALAKMDRDPARIRTKASLSRNFEKDMVLAIDPHRDYGTMPLIVLTAGKGIPTPPGASPAVQEEAERQRVEWARGHADLALLSRRGEHRRVSDSSHYIQLDRPDTVIAAVNQILTEVRTTDRR